MNLYLLTTAGLGPFYIIETDPTRAENSLMDALENANYGFSRDRKILEIKLLANELTIDDNGHYQFYMDNKLLMPRINKPLQD